MRTFPPLNFRLTCTFVVLCGLLALVGPVRADVYDDVERLIRNGQLDRASQTSAEHLKKSPQDPQMRLLGSRILDAQGKGDEAIAWLESLTLEFPELPEPHNNLAVLYARAGRVQDALESLNKALLARPDYAVALENLGDLHAALAKQAYDRAAKAAPTSPRPQSKAQAIGQMLQADSR